MRWVVKLGGYAADRMATSAGKKGARLIGEAVGFLVAGIEGPLKDGELERAEAWARSVVLGARENDAPDPAR